MGRPNLHGRDDEAQPEVARRLTRIAAGRVERGLPLSLRRCGYETVSLYPAQGAFMSARSFQTTTGIEHFHDAQDLGASDLEARQFLP